MERQPRDDKTTNFNDIHQRSFKALPQGRNQQLLRQRHEPWLRLQLSLSVECNIWGEIPGSREEEDRLVAVPHAFLE